LRLEEYNKPKTHLGVLLGGQKRDCPWCGSIQTQRRGTRVTEKGFVNQIMSCSECRKSFTVAASAVKGAEAEVFKG
jgi:transcriptional regulator NrdR family protein